MKMGALDKRRLERELRSYGMPRCWALLAVSRVNEAIKRGDLWTTGEQDKEGVLPRPV